MFCHESGTPVEPRCPHTKKLRSEGGGSVAAGLQGYLAHTKTPPLRTLQ